MGNKKYDDYIVFLLGSDDFGKVTDKLRSVGQDFGMDTEYNLCKEIAKNFQVYDNLHNNFSQYDNLSAYLFENKEKILNFIDGNIDTL